MFTEGRASTPNKSVQHNNPFAYPFFRIATVGRYVAFAVGNVTQKRMAFVLKNGKYSFQRRIQHISFPEFINKYTDKRTLIPILLMDPEGAEWDVLPYIGHYGIGWNFSVDFCQVNAEFHYGKLWRHIGSLKQVQKYYGDFFSKSPFLPLWMSRMARFIRGFMINISNDHCYELFYKNIC